MQLSKSKGSKGSSTPLLIVPTLRVGMPLGTLRVPALERDAERPGLHSHAERGNDLRGLSRVFRACGTRACRGPAVASAGRGRRGRSCAARR
ncbi:hypothetical protein CES87_04720 [Pseudomonas sp. ERMR1:02]|nr:hypothetical protein CES87_04720 [Pseudomonas sp. ERMR1:02]